MIRDKLAILLSRKLAGEASEAEIKELEDWMRNNPDDHFLAELLQSYWKISPPASQFGSNPDTHFQHIIDMAEKEDDAVIASPGNSKVFKVNTTIYRRIAAAILGALLLGGLWYWIATSYGINNIREVAAPRGTKTKVLLPDGSSVWLNAESKIQFNQKFNGPIREVTLQGEAFFDVVKDNKKPFIVHTSLMDIKVLGTSFNVKCYPTDKTIETTLLRGLVEVTPAKGEAGKKILLHPKEKLIYTKTGTIRTVAGGGKNNPNYFIETIPENKPDTSLTETSWMHNRLLFDGDSFEDLAKKMERWYNVEIVFHNKKTAAYRFRGSFEDETIEQVLKGLQLIAPFKYRINEGLVEIY